MNDGLQAAYAIPLLSLSFVRLNHGSSLVCCLYCDVIIFIAIRICSHNVGQVSFFFWLTILRSGNLKDLRSFWSLKPSLDLTMKWRSAWGLSTQKVNPLGYHLSCIVECCGWRIWFTCIAVSFYQSHTLHFSITCFPVSCRTLTTSTHFLVETPGVRKRNISGTPMNNNITYLLSKNVISKGDVNKKRHMKSITLRIGLISKWVVWRSQTPTSSVSKRANQPMVWLGTLTSCRPRFTVSQIHWDCSFEGEFTGCVLKVVLDLVD